MFMEARRRRGVGAFPRPFSRWLPVQPLVAPSNRRGVAEKASTGLVAAVVKEPFALLHLEQEVDQRVARRLQLGLVATRSATL
jgi:hypothetical protein